MNASLTLPVDLNDLEEISRMLADAQAIVSIWPEFSNGDWKALATEVIVHGSSVYAHIDNNALSYLVDVYDGRSSGKQQRSAAAFMSLAVCLGLKVNPTIAIHEYAMTGRDEPDERLAAFYSLDNTHPQLLADFALGRCGSIDFPERGTLEPTKHRGVLKTPIRGHAFYKALVLKIVEIDLDDSYGDRKIKSQAKRYHALVNWMFEELGFGAAACFAANQLWGSYKGKPAIKLRANDGLRAIFDAVENATWDLVAVESWAEYERKRRPGEPMHLFCTFDKALAAIGHMLFVRPTETAEEYTERLLKPFWPEEIARMLTVEYLGLQSRLDDPYRKANQGDGDLASVSEQLCGRIRYLVG